MRALERDSAEWHRVWGALAAGLKATSLPDGNGGAVTCRIDDFMLMGVDDAGTTHFKNIATRRYVLVEADGTLSVPPGAFFLSEGAMA